MSGGYFKALEMENEEELLQERYRYTFLRYLKAASELLELEEGYQHVANLKEISETGRSFDSEEEISYQKNEATTVGKMLHNRFDYDYSSEEFSPVLMKLKAELLVARRLEAMLWGELLEILEKIRVERQADEMEFHAWFFANEVNNHSLMLVGDGLVHDRIKFYEKELEKLDDDPPLPADLETVFLISYDVLLCIIPFSLKQ